MKHICFISRGLKAGGMERSMTSFANYLAEHGYRVTIICLFNTAHFFELHKSIKVVWPKLQRQSFNRLIYAALVAPYIRRTIKSIKPDVILGYGEWFNPYTIFITRFLRIPVYVFDRMGPRMRLDLVVSFGKKIFYRYADGVIAQTNVAVQEIIKKTKIKKIISIPNSLTPINVSIQAKLNVIVSVGRLEKEKGHAILMHAFSKLDSDAWSLHLIGDGLERQTLENLSKELGLEDRVVIHGFQKDFSDILGSAEIFVLPSFYEGYPNALIEAMSVPLCCVSSDCIAGPNEIIENDVNGFLFTPGNIEELACILNNLIDDPHKRREIAAEAYKIRDKLETSRIMKQYLKFIGI